MKRLLLALSFLLVFLTGCSKPVNLNEEELIRHQNIVGLSASNPIKDNYFENLDKIYLDEEEIYNGKDSYSTIYVSVDSQDMVDEITSYVITNVDYIFLRSGVGKYYDKENLLVINAKKVADAKSALEYINSVAASVSIDSEDTDVDKLKNIYTWVLENYTYEESKDSQSLYDAIVEKKTVCTGYAKTFAYIARYYGFDAKAIPWGKTHTRAMVSLNETECLFDPTYDDAGETPQYKYFMFKAK